MSANVVQLGDVAELNPRGMRKLSEDTPVSFVSMADVDALMGVTSRGVDRPYSEVAKGYTQFADRDLLVAKITPCFENGKIAQVQTDRPHGAGSTEFHVIRPDRLRVDDRYLLRFLRQPYVRVAGERRMTGSAGQRRVPEAFLADLQLRLPSLDEQRRIAEVLDRVDALRAKRREAVALLDDLTQSIFLDMFGDPVLNPKGWPMTSLKYMGSLDRGVSKHRPRNDPALLGGSHPLIQTGDVAGSKGYIESYTSTYSDLGLGQSRMWPAGTLCITIAANIAKAGILRFDACFPDSVVGFTSDPDTVEYVRIWLSFLQRSIEASAPESAQKNINLAILRALQIPSPQMPLIHRFAESVRVSGALRATHLSHLSELDALFASLQDWAFRGELFTERSAAA